jgi:hypothetical protein
MGEKNIYEGETIQLSKRRRQNDCQAVEVIMIRHKS